MDPDTQLMARIFTAWGPLIEQVSKASSVPPAFLAALMANESGGDRTARRLEPLVLAHLAQVALGERVSFSPPGAKHALLKEDILNFCTTGVGAPWPLQLAAIGQLAFLARSWGLLQIMGWHVIELSIPAAKLLDPAGNLSTGLVLLTWFAEHYNLALASEFEELLRCWNTGDPIGETRDRHYVPNALRRKQIYESLERGDPT